MKKPIYIFFYIIAILGLIGFLVITFIPEQLAQLVIKQQIQKIVNQNNKNDILLSDKENILICTVGTASPIPGKRVQTGTAIIVNGHFFMFDVGDGVVMKAENLGLPLNKIDGIFMTHWHSDHIMDLPSLISRSWVLGRTNDLHLYGPDGTNSINQSINQFLQIENQHRVDHHGKEMMDISKARAISHEFKNIQGGKEIIYQQDGITITAFDVNHEPIEPAVGYAIEYNGKKVVISGDTKKNEMVLKMAQNADVLLHEVLLKTIIMQAEKELRKKNMVRNSHIMHDILDYHTSPSEVAEIAKKANVKKLVLHHFAPSPDIQLSKLYYLKELKAYKGEIHLSDDGDMIIVK